MVNVSFNCKKASLASGVRKIEFLIAFRDVWTLAGKEVVFGIEVSGVVILLNLWIKC